MLDYQEGVRTTLDPRKGHVDGSWGVISNGNVR